MAPEPFNQVGAQGSIQGSTEINDPEGRGDGRHDELEKKTHIQTQTLIFFWLSSSSYVGLRICSLIDFDFLSKV